MIKSLRLTNFRGFDDHVVEFAPFTLLTGRNNAGKTTIIEALRVISVALSRLRSAKFQMAPAEFDRYFAGPVFRFSLKTLDFDENNIHHNYHYERPAVIQLILTNNCKVTVYLGRDPADRYCQLQLAGGRKVNAKSAAPDTKFHRVFVMPPVGSLLANETERDKKYLHDNINGYLSYRHIRNQMAEMREQFDHFSKELERTWPGLKVQSLGLARSDQGSRYELEIRDRSYPAEIASMGSGLQAWVQTLWFLSRVNSGSIIVLDEPDVYLHADLQKKLIRLLGESDYRQKIVATHSIEMISDVSPEEVVEVQKLEGKSKPISKKSEVQAILSELGTSHHIQLSKLGETGKVLFVEGKDHKFLGLVASKQGRGMSETFEQIPRFSTGGAGNWKRAAMAARVLHETSSGGLTSRLLLDRDYFPQEQLSEIKEQAAKSFLTVDFWHVKEIENFFLDPETIAQFVKKNSSKAVDRIEIQSKFDAIVLSLYERLPGQIGQNLQLADKKLALTTALDRANKLIAERIELGAQKADLVSGKAVFSELSTFTQERYGVSVSATAACREMHSEKVAHQLSDVVKSLCAP